MITFWGDGHALKALKASIGTLCLVSTIVLSHPFPAEPSMDQWAARQVYLENCATCHGFDRMGYIGVALDPSSLEVLSEAAIRSLIRHGIQDTLMPPWNCRLTLDQLRSLSSYLRGAPPEREKRLVVRPDGRVELKESQAWWKDPERIEQGKALFEEFCMGCHHPQYDAFAPAYKDIAHERDISTVMGQIKFPYTSSRILGYAEQTMPKFDLTDDEIKCLGAFIIRWRNARDLQEK